MSDYEEAVKEQLSSILENPGTALLVSDAIENVDQTISENLQQLNVTMVRIDETLMAIHSVLAKIAEKL